MQQDDSVRTHCFLEPTFGKLGTKAEWKEWRHRSQSLWAEALIYCSQVLTVAACYPSLLIGREKQWRVTKYRWPILELTEQELLKRVEKKEDNVSPNSFSAMLLRVLVGSISVVGMEWYLEIVRVLWLKIKPAFIKDNCRGVPLGGSVG